MSISRPKGLSKGKDIPKGFRMAQTWTDRETTPAFPWMDCGKQRITSITIIPGQTSSRTLFAYNNKVRSLYWSLLSQALSVLVPKFTGSLRRLTITHSDVSSTHMDRKLSISYSYRFISKKLYAMYKKSTDQWIYSFWSHTKISAFETKARRKILTFTWPCIVINFL